jgi:hypothetical protein
MTRSFSSALLLKAALFATTLSLAQLASAADPESPFRD